MSSFRRVLVAGFVTDLADVRRRPLLGDLAPAAEPAPQPARAPGPRAGPPAPPGRPREDPRQAGRGRQVQQGGAGAVPAGGRPGAPGRRVLAQDGRGVPVAPHRHRPPGLRGAEPLRLPGRGARGARPADQPARSSCAATATWSARASRLTADFYFVDGRTGADPAQGEVHRGGPLRRGPEDLAALLVLRAHGPAPAQLPGGDLAPEDPRDARPPAIGSPMNTRRSRPALARAPHRVPPRRRLLPRSAAHGPVHPLLREEQGQVRQLRLAGLQEPALRDLLLPRVRAAPRAPRRPTLESGYQKLSSGLKHEIVAAHPRSSSTRPTPSSSRRTSIPSFVPEGVLAFAEPLRGRMVLPIDEPPDRLQGLITARADPRLRVRPHPPQPSSSATSRCGSTRAWPTTCAGMWDPLDLMMIRDAAVTDQVPKLSRVEFEAFSGATRLQPGPRRLRVHRGPLRQGGHPPVPLHLAQEHRGRRASTTSTSRPSGSSPRSSTRPSTSG